MDIFGFQDRVIDRPLLKGTRSLFYMLEKEGLLNTDRADDFLEDGREWRTHYWDLNKNLIIKYSKTYDKNRIDLEEILKSPEKQAVNVYAKEEIWKRKAAKSIVSS